MPNAAHNAAIAKRAGPIRRNNFVIADSIMEHDTNGMEHEPDAVEGGRGSSPGKLTEVWTQEVVHTYD
jgi:hypothetical protein